MPCTGQVEVSETSVSLVRGGKAQKTDCKQWRGKRETVITYRGKVLAPIFNRNLGRAEKG